MHTYTLACSRSKHTATAAPQVALLDADEPLVFMHTVWRAKVVWAVVFAGVVGEANLVRAARVSWALWFGATSHTSLGHT
jgi:hypothetical protein